MESYQGPDKEDERLYWLMFPLSTKLRGNTLIVKFNEMASFTNVKTINSGYNSSFNAGVNGCTKLEEYNLVNITSIVGGAGTSSGENSAPFMNTKIKKLYLPNFKSIGNYCFRGLTSPTIVIGTKFTTIQSSAGNAFSYATGASILIYATTPASGATLNRNGVSNSYIYVPDEVIDTYKASAAFANWKNYIRALSDYTGEKPWEELYPEELGLN